MMSLRLILDVQLEENGISESELVGNLEQIVANAMGNGMGTGPTEAEVIHYDVEIKRMDSMPEI